MMGFHKCPSAHSHRVSGNPKTTVINQTIMKKSSEWDKFSHLFKQQEFSARTTLLQEGQFAKTAYFIEKGCLRTWFNNNGKDITTQFFFEGSSVSSVESFLTNQPSLFCIECVESCILQTISKNDFQFVLENSPIIKDELNNHIFNKLIHCQQNYLSHLKNSPQQRHNELLKLHPEIYQRIPQHYIASYLGITPVSLSRIRNRR